MTKDVLVTISGKRLMGEASEDVELIIPGIYENAGGMHTVVYDEPTEGMEGTTTNTILIGGSGMEIVKRGLANARMSFLNSGKRTTTCYSTPFGDFMIGIRTNDINIAESSDSLHVSVDYSMDVGDEHLSECNIDIDIASRGKAEIHLSQ